MDHASNSKLLDALADNAIRFDDHKAKRRPILRQEAAELAAQHQELPRKATAVGTPRAAAASGSNVSAPVTPGQNPPLPKSETSAQERKTEYGKIVIGLVDGADNKYFDNRAEGQFTNKFGAFRCYCNLPARFCKITTRTSPKFGQHFWGCPLFVNPTVSQYNITCCNFYQHDDIEEVGAYHPSVLRRKDATEKESNLWAQLSTIELLKNGPMGC